jgi:hypothetical protein
MNNPSATIVTCFFDINRAEKGDGRTMDEYKSWIKRSLQLNCQLYVVTEEKFKDFFIENRPKDYAMELKVISFQELHYSKYLEKMQEISQSVFFRNKVAHPNRVECILPEYNVIQYSKFHCLQMAMEENPFQSEFFFWMDAGASRFFYDMDIRRTFPSQGVMNILNQRRGLFIAQHRWDLESYVIDDHFVWKADNLIYGGMFGGSSDVIRAISEKIECILVEKMLAQGNINNEQLALAMTWKDNRHMFDLYCHQSSPMILLKLLSS